MSSIVNINTGQTGKWVRTPTLGYWLLLLVLVLAGWLGLGTPLITVLFSYFVLDRLYVVRKKWLSVIFFVVLVLGIFFGFGHFLKQAIVALPKIIDESFPKIVAFSTEHKITLPFDEPAEVKKWAVESVKEQLGQLGNFAKVATKEFAFVLIGIVVAVCIFLNPQLDLDRGKHSVHNNLYTLACEGIVKRFQSFYRSFARVMGAQLIISMLNTGLTAIYVLCIHLPYAAVVIALTFLCGLLPIIGNLISNTVIVALSFTISPKMAFVSLLYLLVLHKAEYFLNSKIIGDRIRNPVWLTLLGLIIGERLMGIPGMMLAPVVLNFVKVEASSIEVVPGSSVLAGQQWEALEQLPQTPAPAPAPGQAKAI